MLPESRDVHKPPSADPDADVSFDALRRQAG
jgi:hypothetical protein